MLWIHYSRGQKYIEVFNSRGQGMPLEAKTLTFITFLDMNM